MRMKSYFANSVGEAIDKARVELGPDAMLISSRQTDRDLKDLGCYEVVFGVPPATSGAQAGSGAGSGDGSARSEARSTAASQAAAHPALILRELGELKKQVETFRNSISRSKLGFGKEQPTPELAHIFERLTEAGFSNETAQELTEAAALRVHPHTERSHRMIRGHMELFTRDLLDAVLTEEIAARFEIAPSLGTDGTGSGNVLFVGPPGAGKTTSLMKLALQHGLKARRPVHLLSLDTLRIGGWEQLSTYARITGFPFEPLQHYSSLDQALSDRAGKGLTLIDSPGFSKHEEDEAEELARITGDADLEVQLVLPANLNIAVAQQTCQRFAKFRPAKLVLTHCDEVEAPGAIIELAMRSGLPISYLANGQHVPEDICSPDKAELTEQLLPRMRAAYVAA